MLAENQAHHTLWESSHILVLPADKGNAMVIFSTTGNRHETFALLEDPACGIRMAKDPTRTNILKLFSCSQDAAQQWRPLGSRMPWPYRLPKILLSPSQPEHVAWENI
jgi:hypothetical protein